MMKIVNSNLKFTKLEKIRRYVTEFERLQNLIDYIKYLD